MNIAVPFTLESEQAWSNLPESGHQVDQDMNTIEFVRDGAFSRERGPTQRLADAVLTQAFRDLRGLDADPDDVLYKSYETARAFLLGETPEGLEARTTYCDALELDPSYVERMAHKVLAIHAANAQEQASANKGTKTKRKVA